MVWGGDWVTEDILDYGMARRLGDSQIYIPAVELNNKTTVMAKV